MKKILFILVALAACGSDDKKTPDAGMIHEVDAAPDSPQGPDCFTGTPTTHDEIINACAAPGVTVIHKHPNLPLLNADGSLPPLP
jgi:hypothetical protein